MLTMNAKDTVSAALAECFVTIGEKRYSCLLYTSDAADD